MKTFRVIRQSYIETVDEVDADNAAAAEEAVQSGKGDIRRCSHVERRATKSVDISPKEKSLA